MKLSNLIPVVSILLSLMIVPAVEARTWTATSGGTLEAEFISTDGSAVTIKRADGQTVTIPLEKLSKGDQDFVATRKSGKSSKPKMETVEDISPAMLTGEWVKGNHRGTLPFQIYGPAKPDGSKRYPLVLYLHGKNGSGSDGENQMQDGAAESFVKPENFERYPCVVVAPQIRPGKFWTSRSGDEAIGLLTVIIEKLPIDRKRVYICGHSIGAVGIWNQLRRRSGIFAAAVIVSGASQMAGEGHHHGGDGVPLWAFHGAADEVVPVDKMRDVLKRVSVGRAKWMDLKYTEYPGEGHEIVEKVFSTPELFDWLFAQKRRD